jgi:uncharacterized protein (DUF1778 family)
MAVEAVGTLLLFALVVTPAATAIMTPRPGVAMAIATVISLLSVWVGLGLSATLNVPPSFTIVTIACAVWFVVWGLYIVSAYTSGVETKGARWSLRVTAAQDAVVRRVLDVTGESLNEYVVRHAVHAAETDLADRRVFVLDDAAWSDLQALLDRPPNPKPELAHLLANPSILER